MSGSASISQISRAEYDRIDAVNWSTLKHIAKSPAHYRHALLTRHSSEGDTTARKLGRVTHLAVLEPELFHSSVAVWTGGRRAGSEWKAFCEEHEGQELLTQEEFDHCVALNQAVLANPIAASYLSGGQREATLRWTHEIEELPGYPGALIECKARTDFIGRLALVDLKSTRDASPDGFGREVWKYRYHTQAAIYSDGYFAATGKRLPYVLIAAEKTAPLAVQVYVVPPAILERGRDEYRSLLERLAFCRRENRWPAYAEGELEVELPRWATFDDDDEDLGGLDISAGE